MFSENQRGNLQTTYVDSYCVFDFETTGVSTEEDEVIEISAIKVVDGEVVDTFSTLVRPERPIPAAATAVNGITNEMVAGAMNFDTAMKYFLEFVGDMVLVGHNIHAFDMKFIHRFVETYLEKYFGNNYIDTLRIARTYLPELSRHTLTALAEHYGINSEGAHRALTDCRMNQLIYERLGQEMQNPSAAAMAALRCPRCGNVLAKRNGKFGEFWGCTNYPECRFTRNV